MFHVLFKFDTKSTSPCIGYEVKSVSVSKTVLVMYSAMSSQWMSPRNQANKETNHCVSCSQHIIPKVKGNSWKPRRQ